jgi:nitroreductase
VELYEVMRTTASVRRFRTDPVPDDLLHRVLDNARFAASGGNRQAWRVVVVRDARLRTALAELYRRQPYGGPSAASAADEATRRRIASVVHYTEHLHELPVQLVVAVEISALHLADAELDRPSIIGGASIYPFIQNILLGLRNEGLGATLTTRVVHDEPEVLRLLDIPDTHAVAAHLGVGWPEGAYPTRLRRRPVEDFASLDTFSGPRL